MPVPAAAAQPSHHPPPQGKDAALSAADTSIQEVAGKGSRIPQEHSPAHPLSQKDLRDTPPHPPPPPPPGHWLYNHNTQLQAWGRRTSGSKERELLLQFWKSCLIGPSESFAFSLSSDAGKVGEVQDSFRETTWVIRVILKFGISREAVREWGRWR